jgi:hypothetical protein
MKITIILTLLIAFISILGMFYWMWKAKSGQLDLSLNSWHIILKKWMWDFEPTGLENACPYYWGLVFSIIVLPLYLLILVLVKIHKFISIKLDILFDKIFGNIKKPNINFNINVPLPKIPETKKEMYSKIYTNSKEWLTIGFFSIIVIVIFILLIVFIFKSFTANSYLGWFVLFILTFGISLILQHILKEEWDGYFYNHVDNLFSGIKGLVQLPFIILFYLIRFPIIKIFKIYENNCPPINWIENE